MKNRVLRMLALLAAVVMTVSLAACKDETATTLTGGDSTAATTVSGNEGTTATTASDIDQLAAPQSGDTIATMTIKGYGDVKIRLFKNSTPKAFENFTTHAKNGYYDGLKFHRVIENFMIQGGDPEGTGMGGESIWGEGFGIETDKNLRHYAGALAMAQSSLPNSIGSQFYIVTGEVYDESTLSQMAAQGYSITDASKKQYTTIGGAPFLDDQYTVFGQVYEGYDIVEKISKVETDASDMPTKDVVIETIKIETVA